MSVITALPEDTSCWGRLDGPRRRILIHGVIAFDGTISGGGEAELGKLAEPVRYIVKRGRIQEIQGRRAGGHPPRLLQKLDDPNMYIAAHVCYGVNPNARLEGCTTEDERVWGKHAVGIRPPGFLLFRRGAQVRKEPY